MPCFREMHYLRKRKGSYITVESLIYERVPFLFVKDEVFLRLPIKL